jgi:hypothetical protein
VAGLGTHSAEMERRVTAERRGRGGGSAQTSSLGPSTTMQLYYKELPSEKGACPEYKLGYAGHRHVPEII